MEITGLKKAQLFAFLPVYSGEDGLRAVFGCEDGNISMASIVPGNAASNALWTVQLPNAITAMTITENSRIFVACGSEVFGITRKVWILQMDGLIGGKAVFFV